MVSIVPNPVTEARRNAVEALAATTTVLSEQELLARADLFGPGLPAEVNRLADERARACVMAYARLAGITFDAATNEITELALALHPVREAAQRRWNARLAEHGNDPLRLLRFMQEPGNASASIAQYAEAAGLTYAEACLRLCGASWMAACMAQPSRPVATSSN